MESVSQIAQALQHILNEQADSLGKETKFIQREREIKGSDFAQALIGCPGCKNQKSRWTA
jgi:hypothetical protein